VEMYNNTGLGYAEIELEPEQVLRSGDRLENILTIECLSLPAGLAPSEAAAQVKKLLGEK